SYTFLLLRTASYTFLPTARISTSWLVLLIWVFNSLITEELKAPASPLLEVITIYKTFFTSLSAVNVETPSKSVVELTFSIISCNFSDYIRKITLAAVALFSFAAETIFIALVICIVEEIEVILARISFKFAIFL